jgi:hypothetical protein
MMYFIVVVVTAFSDLWPKKVIIYKLVIVTLIPKYRVFNIKVDYILI